MMIYPYFNQQKKVQIIAHQMKRYKQIYNKLHEKKYSENEKQ